MSSLPEPGVGGPVPSDAGATTVAVGTMLAVGVPLATPRAALAADLSVLANLLRFGGDTVGCACARACACACTWARDFASASISAFASAIA